MKYIIVLGFCALLAACGSTGGGGGASAGSGGGGQATVEKLKPVPGVTSRVTGMREVMKATVDGKEVVAVLAWRDYSAKLDDSVSKWYGDMGRPPAKFVVKSLLISIDGKGMIVPQAKTRYLASQWMNDSKSLGLYRQGKNLCVYVDVGDGAEGWTASYVVNPVTGSLVSHQVEDGPTFHNSVDAP